MDARTFCSFPNTLYRPSEHLSKKAIDAQLPAASAPTDLTIVISPSNVVTILQTGTNTYRVQPFGLSSDKIVPADYDGDGRSDFAVFRPATGDWYILTSSDNLTSRINWGISTDKPVPADYDGDGRIDMAVYRNGTWYIKRNSGGIDYQQFGLSTDVPIAGVSQKGERLATRPICTLSTVATN